MRHLHQELPEPAKAGNRGVLSRLRVGRVGCRACGDGDEREDVLGPAFTAAVHTSTAGQPWHGCLA
ncbi:hypothetical protein ABZ281_04545 [Streptomyces sp. NPDC006265]|uniref:hypothetical protein n=1 Tax=Streptomyces sp. NPDC006265 TaxID=3156740 RepID=UPI0033AEE4C7